MKYDNRQVRKYFGNFATIAGVDSGYQYACCCGARYNDNKELIGKERWIDIKPCTKCKSKKESKNGEASFKE